MIDHEVLLAYRRGAEEIQRLTGVKPNVPGGAENPGSALEDAGPSRRFESSEDQVAAAHARGRAIMANLARQQAQSSRMTTGPGGRAALTAVRNSRDVANERELVPMLGPVMPFRV